jgi:hypothetical protein
MPSEEGGGVRACPTGLRRPGDTDGLIRLLAADVVAYADGGGKTQPFLRPMYGRGRIARLLLRFGTWLELLGVEGMRLAEVNGQPGAVFLGHDGRLVLVVSLDIPRDWSRPSAPSAIRTSCVTSTRGPVALGRLIAELQFDVPRQLQERSSGIGGDEGKVLHCLGDQTQEGRRMS